MLGVRMTDPLRNIVSGAPAVIEPWVTLRQAATGLTAETIGVLLVEDPRGLLGIVSERDIVRALAEGADPDVERVRDVMTYDLVKLEVEVTVEDAAAAMANEEIRHVAVVDGQIVIGVVSVRDLLSVVIEGSTSSVTPPAA